MSAILFAGLTPVFVDIEPDTYLIDAARIEAKITAKTRVISPVHLFGLVADMDMIGAIADRHGLTERVLVSTMEESSLALLRERFARSAGRPAEPRQLGPEVVVLRIALEAVSGRTVER